MDMKWPASLPSHGLRNVEVGEPRVGGTWFQSPLNGGARFRTRQDHHVMACPGKRQRPVPSDGELRSLVRLASKGGEKNLQVLPRNRSAAVGQCPWPATLACHAQSYLRGSDECAFNR